MASARRRPATAPWIDDGAEVPPADAVPGAFTLERPRRPRDGSAAEPAWLDRVLHCRVVVRANGIDYRGVLDRHDDHELLLRTPARFLTIAIERVAWVRRDDDGGP